MKSNYQSAADLFSQLGNITRLKIVCELVRAGKDGMSVGNIKKILQIPDSTLSHHINHLKNVGLIWQERESNVLRCFVDQNKLNDLMAFLTKECHIK